MRVFVRPTNESRNIPDTEHSSVVRFLESQGLKEEALDITKDPDQKFDLALELEKLDIAHELMTQLKESDKDTTGKHKSNKNNKSDKNDTSSKRKGKLSKRDTHEESRSTMSQAKLPRNSHH